MLKSLVMTASLTCDVLHDVPICVGRHLLFTRKRQNASTRAGSVEIRVDRLFFFRRSSIIKEERRFRRDFRNSKVWAYLQLNCKERDKRL